VLKVERHDSQKSVFMLAELYFLLSIKDTLFHLIKSDFQKIDDNSLTASAEWVTIKNKREMIV